MSEDTKRRGWVWPNTGNLKDPIAYLRWRLAQIDWSVPSPTEIAIAAKNTRNAQRRATERETVDRNGNAASRSTRESAMARIRATLNRASR
ncbi:hypothetical protein GCM10023094_41540 [Rhodococcus olei]|uniref:Uncharacterized protein n=1 Tax=Rhodococcus olei TaxID=2161675 RepID=A0ABP8PH02_9NOCA